MLCASAGRNRTEGVLLKTRVPIPERIKKLATYFVANEGRERKLRLDFNENTVGASAAVARAIRKLSPEQIAMYPEYEKVSTQLAKYFGAHAREMQFSNGADGAIGQIALTFLQPGDRVLMAAPTFPMYRFYTELVGARVESLAYDSLGNLPVSDLLRALKSKPRIFFLANPNNPTGTLAAPRDIRRFIESSPQTLIVIDEAYFDFSRVTVLPWIRKYPNLIVLRTFSKATGMAGLRLGCIFACPELIGWLAKTQDPFPVNAAAIAAAEAIARNPKAVSAYAHEIRRARDQFAEELDARAIDAIPSAANFLLVDFRADRKRIIAAMAKKGILLRSRAGDLGRDGFVRVTIGTRAQMKRLLRELDKLL